jgi:hypothetical protein
MGVTSRGVFVRSAADRVVFVSQETHRSPLTITLTDPIDRLRSLEVGAVVQFSDTRLIFPALEVAISLSANVIWHCPSPVSPSRPRTAQRQSLRAIAESALARAGSPGLTAVLLRLLDLPDALPLSGDYSALLERLIAVRRTIESGDDQQMIAGLLGLLGQGRGLTPSGDDVVIGLLLMRNRWHTGRDCAMMNRSLSEAAYQTTTTISANLIECAADGQGDERLITVVDGVATGSTSIDECAACVLDWGSTSGIDALTGMALAV